MSFRRLCVLATLFSLSIPGCSRPAPPASPSLTQQQAADSFRRGLGEFQGQVAAAEKQLKVQEVAVVVDGVRDSTHNAEISHKVQQLKDPDSTSHSFSSRGSTYSGSDSLFVISPILDVVDAADRIDFGRVTGVDVANRTILVDAGVEKTERPTDGWPGSDAIDQFILKRAVAAASVAAVQSLVDKYGRDKVVVIRVPEEPVNAEGVHPSPDLHPLVPKIREVAPESLTSTDDCGPQGQYYVTITVAPMDDVAAVLKLLGEKKPLVVDAAARVILIGDIDRLRPRATVPAIFDTSLLP